MKLAKCENHKTAHREENSFLVKKISFQLFTSYFALVFYTFDKQNFDLLSNQVTTFIIASNSINMIKYIVLPYMFYCCRKRRFYKKWRKHRVEAKKRVLEHHKFSSVTDLKCIPEDVKKHYSDNKLDITEALVECLQFEEELIHTEQIEVSRCMTDLGS